MIGRLPGKQVDDNFHQLYPQNQQSSCLKKCYEFLCFPGTFFLAWPIFKGRALLGTQGVCMMTLLLPGTPLSQQTPKNVDLRGTMWCLSKG